MNEEGSIFFLAWIAAPAAPLGMSAQAQVPEELIQYPELILQNGKILTVDANFRVVEALAVRGGEILSVGSDAEMLRLKGPQTTVVDLQVGGKVLRALAYNAVRPHRPWRRFALRSAERQRSCSRRWTRNRAAA